MAEADNQPDDAAKAKADATALAEQAEADAAQAEALAAAARARARAIRLRRQAEAEAESAQAAAATTAPTETTAAPAESPDLTSEAAESAEPALAPAEPTRRPRLRVATALAVVAIVAICGLLAASGYMIWYHHTAVEQRQRAAAFAAAARQGVINMLSMDFKKAKEDVQRVIDNSTGEFKDDFQKRAGDFTTVVEQSEVVTEGAVATTGVESMGKDSAVVLVLGTERVTNAAGAKDEPRAFRLRVSVARDGDRIKLSKVEFVL